MVEEPLIRAMWCHHCDDCSAGTGPGQQATTWRAREMGSLIGAGLGISDAEPASVAGPQTAANTLVMPLKGCVSGRAWPPLHGDAIEGMASSLAWVSPRQF